MEIEIKYHKEGWRTRYVAFCPLCKGGDSLKVDCSNSKDTKDAISIHLKKVHNITEDINFVEVKSSPKEVQD